MSRKEEATERRSDGATKGETSPSTTRKLVRAGCTRGADKATAQRSDGATKGRSAASTPWRAGRTRGVLARAALVACGAIVAAFHVSAARGDVPELQPTTSAPAEAPIAILGPPFATPPLRIGIVALDALPQEAPGGSKLSAVRKLFTGLDGFEPVEINLAATQPDAIAPLLRSCSAAILWSEPFLTTEIPTMPPWLEPALLDAVKGGTGLLVADRAWWMVWKMPALQAAIHARRLEVTPASAGTSSGKRSPLDDLDSGLLSLQVDDRFHAAARAMNTPWLLTGTVVALGPHESSATVRGLMRVDATNMDISTLGLDSADAAKHSIVWAVRVGRGAVVCSGIGSGADTAEDEYYLEHLQGAIRWCAGAYDAPPALPGCPEPPYETLAEGLRVHDLRVGKGDLPAMRYKVTLHLRATLPDGRLLKDTRWEDAPLSFTIGMFEVMEGLEAAVLSMKPGGRRIALVPPELQGRAAFPGKPVPRNTLIRLDVELIATR